MFCSGGEGLDWVREKLAGEAQATLAVAFWGAGAIEALGLASRENKAGNLRIICNLSMGGTNPSEISKLRSMAGVSVEQCDSLHGKVYLFNDAVMIGSSNASSNGLSFEGAEAMGWEEANIVTNHTGTVSDAFDWVANLPTREITQQDIERAEKAWKARRKAKPVLHNEVSITEILDRGPAALAGLDIYLTLAVGEFSEEAENTIEAAKQDHPIIDAWEDWVDLPPSGTFISFAKYSVRGRFKYEACYQRTPSVPDRPESAGKYSLQWCFECPLPLGLKSPSKESPEWANIITKLMEDRGNPKDAQYIRLEDLAELWAISRST